MLSDLCLCIMGPINDTGLGDDQAADCATVLSGITSEGFQEVR